MSFTINRFNSVPKKLNRSGTIDEYLVPPGWLFYDTVSNTLRIGNGQTIGGVILGAAGGNSFSGSYDDLTNQPTIPSDISDLTDTTNLLSGTNPTFQTLTVSNGSAGYESQLIVNDGRILFRNYNNRQGVAGYDYSNYNGIVVDTTASGYTVVSGENSGSSSSTSFTFDFRKLANGTSAQRMGVLRFDSGIDNGPSLSNAVSMKYLPTTDAQSNGTFFEFATTGLRFPDSTVQTTAWTGTTAPAHSFGTLGDEVGMVAFDADYIYYCFAIFRPLVTYTAAVSQNGGSTFEVYQTAGTPLIGDRLYGSVSGPDVPISGGEGLITNVQASTEGGQPTWLLTVTQIDVTSIGVTANQTCSIGTPDIWKRTVHGTGTW